MPQVSILQRLSAKLRLWGDALAGTDDPLGEYLLKLEERVGRLEGEMERLRKPASANEFATETMAGKVLPPERSAYPRATDLV